MSNFGTNNSKESTGYWFHIDIKILNLYLHDIYKLVQQLDISIP